MGDDMGNDFEDSDDEGKAHHLFIIQRKLSAVLQLSFSFDLDLSSSFTVIEGCQF